MQIRPTGSLQQLVSLNYFTCKTKHKYSVGHPMSFVGSLFSKLLLVQYFLSLWQNMGTKFCIQCWFFLI